MGKQQKLKDQRKTTMRRNALLDKIGLPFPSELAAHPAADVLIGIYAEAAGRYTEPLAASMSPHGLRRAAHAALLYLDELLRKIPTTVNFAGEGRLTIDCRSGCNYCCTIRVTTSGPFVLALAHYLKKKLSPEQMTALLTRMEVHVADGLRLNPLEQILKSRMCPLNVDGLCIGYEYRPFGCRTYHSFDVRQCRADMEAEVKDVMVPQDPERLAMQSLVVKPISECTKKLGINDDELEFVPALLIALRDPDAADRYMRGEPVFATAHRPDVVQAQVRDMEKRGLTFLPQAKR